GRAFLISEQTGASCFASPSAFRGDSGLRPLFLAPRRQTCSSRRDGKPDGTVGNQSLQLRLRLDLAFSLTEASSAQIALRLPLRRGRDSDYKRARFFHPVIRRGKPG